MTQVALAAHVKASKDAAFLQSIFEDLHTSDSTRSEDSSGSRTVADGATEAIPFGDVSEAKTILVRASRRVTLKVTSSAGAEQLLLVGTAAAEGGFLLLEGSATALSIVNNSGASALVRFFLAG